MKCLLFFACRDTGAGGGGSRWLRFTLVAAAVARSRMRAAFPSDQRYSGRQRGLASLVVGSSAPQHPLSSWVKLRAVPGALRQTYQATSQARGNVRGHGCSADCSTHETWSFGVSQGYLKGKIAVWSRG